MIALDTNILVRYLLNDSPSECEVAENLLFSTVKSFAPVTVLLELVWVLESKLFSRASIAGSIPLLRNLKDFSFADSDAVNASLFDRHGPTPWHVRRFCRILAASSTQPGTHHGQPPL